MAGVDPYLKLFSDILQALKKHPEKVLPYVMMLFAAILFRLGMDAWLACSFSLAIYVSYCVRATLTERHEERLAEKRIEELEQTKGLLIKKKGQKYIVSRRRKP